MSEEESDLCCCASCGMTAVDDIKLKKCACNLVRYCSVKCQKEHRPQHKRECKKRVAELRDEILFKQPESTHLGDCPICFLPHPLWTSDSKVSTLMSCCSKIICKGCSLANYNRQIGGMLELTCPFCRQLSKSLTEEYSNLMKRAEANDPVAIREVGAKRYNEVDYSSAFDCWTKAAGLGDSKAHYNLSVLYQNGLGVERDKRKEVYHLEEAAIRVRGHVISRFNLGCEEGGKGEKGTMERAVKHYIIAANHGYDDAIEVLRDCYSQGLVRKEEFATALRAYQAAVDATKSPQRDEATKRWIEFHGTDGGRLDRNRQTNLSKGL